MGRSGREHLLLRLAILCTARALTGDGPGRRSLIQWSLDAVQRGSLRFIRSCAIALTNPCVARAPGGVIR